MIHCNYRIQCDFFIYVFNEELLSQVNEQLYHLIYVWCYTNHYRICHKRFLNKTIKINYNDNNFSSKIQHKTEMYYNINSKTLGGER